MRRRATLKDVANLAGVSIATVARVLHNNGYVAEQTRRNVEAVLSQTGYQINAVAQGLRRQRTHTIGLLQAGPITNQFFAAVASGVEEVAAAHRCGVATVNTNGQIERERSGVESLIQRRVDAVLFTIPMYQDNVKIAIEAGIPVVQIERMCGVITAHVTADNLGGSYVAVKHLIDLGHRRIAIVGVDPDFQPTDPGFAAVRSIERDRLSGYLSALGDAGLEVNASFIALWPDYYTGGTDDRQNPGYISTLSLCGMDPSPTAIFFTSDDLAAGGLQALYERRFRVPLDMSVIGFDNIYAPYLSPPLTTVENPMREMGRAAARLVFDHLDERAVLPEEQIELPMNLIVRTSTAPPSR